MLRPFVPTVELGFMKRSAFAANVITRDFWVKKLVEIRIRIDQVAVTSRRLVLFIVPKQLRNYFYILSILIFAFPRLSAFCELAQEMNSRLIEALTQLGFCGSAVP